MGWAKWATLIGGAALAPVTAGASLAIAAPIAAALDQKDAIKKANSQQQAATTQSTSALDQGYQTAQGALQPALSGIQAASAAAQPYQQLGQQSANALSSLLGFGGLAAAPSPTSGPSPSSGMPVSMPSMPASAPSGEPGGHQTLNNLIPTDATDDQRMPSSLSRAIAARSQSQSSYAPNIQGPDGKFYAIPEDQIENALANGGRRLTTGRA